jgi:hypothetical protein
MTGYLVLCARVMIGAVLLVSVAGKTHGRLAFGEFQNWLRDLTVIPQRLTTAVAVTMVAAEAAAVALLAFPMTLALGLAWAAATFAIFAASIAWIAHLGVSVPCRCFGTSARPLGLSQIVRDIALALVAAWAAVSAYLEPQPVPPAPGVAAALLLGAAATVLVIRLDDVVELFVPLTRHISPLPK